MVKTFCCPSDNNDELFEIIKDFSETHSHSGMFSFAREAGLDFAYQNVRSQKLPLVAL